MTEPARPAVHAFAKKGDNRTHHTAIESEFRSFQTRRCFAFECVMLPVCIYMSTGRNNAEYNFLKNLISLIHHLCLFYFPLFNQTANIEQ